MQFCDVLGLATATPADVRREMAAIRRTPYCYGQCSFVLIPADKTWTTLSSTAGANEGRDRSHSSGTGRPVPVCQAFGRPDHRELRRSRIRFAVFHFYDLDFTFRAAHLAGFRLSGRERPVRDS